MKKKGKYSSWISRLAGRFLSAESIKTLSLSEDEVLVVKIPEKVRTEAMKQLAAILAQRFPGNQILLTFDNFQFFKVSQEAIETRYVTENMSMLEMH
jgi:hypothetical protein